MRHPFGLTFSDQISQGKRRRSVTIPDFEQEEKQTPQLRIFVVLFVLGLGFLISRLFSITILEGNHLRQLSIENRIREEKITASRGIIYDRFRIPLVRNIPQFKTEDGDMYLEHLPKGVSADFTETVTRQYLYSDSFAHVIGYVGEIDENEISESQKSSPRLEYKAGDVIGKMGVEKSFDRLLRGVDGKQLFEVDAIGNKVRVMGRFEPLSGQALVLTMDVRLQETAKQALGEKIGAVIAADPNTGEILSIYSSPSFDPNAFIEGGNIGTILTDPDKPLFHRAVRGTYPPGSTFKIVTSVAALEEGAINKNTKIEDTGIVKIGTFSFGNWYFLQYGKTEGMVDIQTAIKRSNDIFFYKAAELVGITKLAQWGRKMGIGEKYSTDIDGISAGFIPDPQFVKNVKGEDWYLGNTYHIAIGQGELTVTPLEVNTWTNVIANKGKLCTPHLAGNKNSACKDLGIKETTINIVREGMRQACDTGGTGWPLFKFKVQNSKIKIDNVDFKDPIEASSSGKDWVEIPIACKTGTAEFGDSKNSTHAWLTAFAPVYDPQISITVLVEGGGEGSSVAAPIAKKMLEEWFEESENN